MAITTIYWGITNNTLYLSSSSTSQASTSFNADNTSNSSTYWPWTNSKATLTNVIVQNNVEFNATNLTCMFQDCTSLTSLDLSNFNTSNVTRMGNMFRNCSSLTSLSISNFNTSNVVSMNSMFRDCSSLTSLNISSFNTSNVTDMGYMFYNCKALTSLNISNFNTSKVATMACMFYNCNALTSLNLSNFNTSNVTNMYTMFSGCKALISLDISSFNTSKVTNMSNMFSSCNVLTSLDVSSFNTSNVTNMSYMFSTCKALTSLNLSNFNTSSVTNMSYMFQSCETLTLLDISNFNTPNVTNMSYMFSNCKALTSLNLFNFDTSKVTNMSYMFYYCEDLISLNLFNFNTSGVLDISRMFYMCSSLTSLDISSFNTSNVTNMGYMFYYCTNLEKIMVSTLWDSSAATTSTSMFSHCTKIEGQNGTTYNSSIIDKTYAKVDEPNSPGYFWLRVYPKILLDAYHYTAADTNGRTDACKLVLDSNKEGESSSVPNDGAIWIPPTTGTLSVNYGGTTYRTGGDSFTMNSNSLGGSTSILPIVGTYSDFSDADIISIVDCPSGWSTNSPMTIEQIRNTTEADFEALPTPRIGFYYDPSRSTDYAKYRCEYGWSSEEADGETYTYTIKMNDPNLTRHTLHLKGFHEFDFNYTEYPEVIIGPKTLVLNNTGYSLTERSGSSLGEEDYSLTVPERWSWYESGTHEVWIEYAAGEDGDKWENILYPVEGTVTAELFYDGSSLGVAPLELFNGIPFELGATEGYINYMDPRIVFVHLYTPAEYPLSFKVVYTNP